MYLGLHSVIVAHTIASGSYPDEVVKERPSFLARLISWLKTAFFS